MSVAAIVKARTWIDDLVSGHVQSFAEIAQHEGKVERHVRLLAPLAFTPPGMLAAIIAGAAPNDLTVTALAQTIPNAWERSGKTAGGIDFPNGPNKLAENKTVSVNNSAL